MFFKMEAVVPYSESPFFNIIYPASGNEFSACGDSVFLVRAILLLLEIIIKRYGSFFRLVETSISTKSFIMASGNRFSG